MISLEQLKEIREHLDRSQNPLFFFDNDADGLCSFLLLKRYIGRGKGVPIRSFPELNISYSRKINELNPDYVFILDKPIVSTEFLKSAADKNIPVVWIDHHDVDVNLKNKPGVYYYNSMKSEKPDSRPTSYWCYQVSKKKEDLWIALVGCIADSYLPEFSEDAAFKFPQLWNSNIKSAFQGVYETQFGKIARIFSFALKDRTSNVINLIKFLSKVKEPEEVFQESYYNTGLNRFNQINKKYQYLMAKARNQARETFGKILYFQYGGELSLSSDIANELFYRFPEKVIIVSYIKGAKANLSLRANIDILSITSEALNGIPGATGGGHKHSIGASMPAEDVLKFKEKIEELLKEE